MKHSKKISVLINNKVISYTNKIQSEHIMQFVNLILKLYVLAKTTKNFTNWYTWIANLGCKNLLYMYKYIMSIDEVSDLAPNKICR